MEVLDGTLRIPLPGDIARKVKIVWKSPGEMANEWAAIELKDCDREFASKPNCGF